MYLDSEIEFYEPVDHSPTDNKNQLIETEPPLNTKRPALTQSPTLSVSTVSNNETPYQAKSKHINLTLQKNQN